VYAGIFSCPGEGKKMNEKEIKAIYLKTCIYLETCAKVSIKQIVEDYYKESADSFIRLLKIMDQLREECPWDKKQTNETLRSLTIEEVHELSDAIMDNDDMEIKKELGDLLLHIVFYSKIGHEKKKFTVSEMIETICEKLIFRHPHIFGDLKVQDEHEVKRNWEKLKMKEGRKSVLEGVPRSLTGLLKAYRLQEKAAGVGFDWNTKEDVWQKVHEELHEWKEAIESGNKEEMEDELGDLIFSLVNYTRFIHLNPEDALERSNKKFIKRFQFIEKRSEESGKSISDMSFDEMEAYYQEAKVWEKGMKEGK
jgi:XTP/dITP diphosphohydrolase